MLQGNRRSICRSPPLTLCNTLHFQRSFLLTNTTTITTRVRAFEFETVSSRNKQWKMQYDIGGGVGMPTRPAWDMDSLKRAICLARTGTGSVHRVIETCAFKPREQAFTSLIKLCGQLRDWRKATEVFEAMQCVKGVRPNTYTYSALIATCSAAGEWHKALEFYELMKYAALGNPDCSPNKVTYSVLITACEKGGLYVKALEVYDEMVASVIPGDEITFRAVLSACEKSGNWAKAERVLQDVHAKGLSVDSGIYSEMMLNYAQEGDWSKALDMCLTMQLAGQDPSDGPGGAGKKGRGKKANKKRNKGKKGVPEFDLKDLALFQMAPNIAPDKPAWDMDTLKRAVCFAQTGSGEVRKVIENCTFIPREQAFTAMINMCGRLRDWRKATEVFEAMSCVRGVRPNTYTYSALISACSTSGEWQKALEVFEVMKISARTNPNCKPNEVTFSTVITACQRGGMVDEALELYKEMLASGLVPDQGSFNSVLAACEKSERWEDVEKILEHMHSRGLSASPALYADLIENYSEKCDWRKALDVFLNMQLARVVPDKNVVWALMKALEKGGQHQMVLDLFGEMQESGIAVDAEAFKCAIRALAEREKETKPSLASGPLGHHHLHHQHPPSSAPPATVTPRNLSMNMNFIQARDNNFNANNRFPPVPGFLPCVGVPAFNKGGMFATKAGFDDDAPEGLEQVIRAALPHPTSPCGSGQSSSEIM